MSQRDDLEWDRIAGDYVRGTLSESEQRLYTNIHQHDVDFQERVRAWRERLALSKTTAGSDDPDGGESQTITREPKFSDAKRHPPNTAADDFDRDAREDLSTSLSGDMASVMASRLEIGLNSSLNHHLDDSLDDSLDHSLDNHRFANHSADLSGNSSKRLSRSFDDTTGEFTQKQRPFPQNKHRSSERINFWRTLAAVAMVAVLAMAILLWFKLASPKLADTSATTEFLSLIVDKENSPLWLVEGANSTSQIRVIALKPPVISEDSVHELWLVTSENQDVVSLGMLPNRAGQLLVIPFPDIKGDVSEFAVSLEPEPGSSAGTPGGPLLYQGGWRAIQSDL